MFEFSTGILTAAYIAAGVMFILALGGLSNQESAKRAIWYGIVGMAVAVASTVATPGIGNVSVLIALMVIGSLIGAVIAMRVEMTGMPQLVAALHSFVGLAAVFIGINAELELALLGSATGAGELAGFAEKLSLKTEIEISILKVEVFLSIFIGAITFTGSVVAFGKLAGMIDGKPRKLPGGHFWNAAMTLACVVLGYLYLAGGGVWLIAATAVIAGIIGWHLIMGIGGADMPVVVSMLNSYSGWAAAAVGFTLGQRFVNCNGSVGGLFGRNSLVHYVSGNESPFCKRYIGRVRGVAVRRLRKWLASRSQ